MQNAPTPPPRQRPRPTFRKVRVVSASDLTPHVRRIVFGGEDLAGFASRGPAEHIKVFFPPPGEIEPVVPVWGPNGPEPRPGRPLPVSRTYTPRRWDPERLELEVHFALHSDGPGSRWARGAKPGDIAVIAGPGRPYQIDPAASWRLIGGDDTALPAIHTILEALPPGAPAYVYIEVEGPEDEQPLASRAPFAATWLHRRGVGLDEPGRLLERAIRGFAVPQGQGAVWIGCEAGVMREIRHHLLYDRGISRELLCTRGYWKMGTPNHPDHDMGEDV